MLPQKQGQVFLFFSFSLMHWLGPKLQPLILTIFFSLRVHSSGPLGVCASPKKGVYKDTLIAIHTPLAWTISTHIWAFYLRPSECYPDFQVPGSAINCGSLYWLRFFLLLLILILLLLLIHIIILLQLLLLRLFLFFFFCCCCWCCFFFPFLIFAGIFLINHLALLRGAGAAKW